jgi:surfeit locus 1 family protein
MRRPPLLPTILTLVSIVFLCGLGSWQVQRLHWKEGLLAKLDAAYRETNPPLLNYAAVARMAASGGDFAAARLKGHLTGNPEMLLGMRTWRGRTGYHALAVLEMPGGAVLVNRGWVPAAAKKTPLRAPSGPVTVRGILHRAERANPFVPANDPAKNAWYRWDLPQMARAAGVKNLSPLVLYEQSESGPQTDYPVRQALRWELPNNHLGYAGFWFGMAGVMAVIYYLRFIRK